MRALYSRGLLLARSRAAALRPRPSPGLATASYGGGGVDGAPAPRRLPVVPFDPKATNKVSLFGVVGAVESRVLPTGTHKTALRLAVRGRAPPGAEPKSWWCAGRSRVRQARRRGDRAPGQA